MSAQIDHKALGLSRVATQYKESQKFLDFLRAILETPNELEGVIQDVSLITDIDTAEGVNLDVIGDIVGVSRFIDAAIPVGFFGFEDTAGALNFGEEGLIAIGGRFREEDESHLAGSVLQDPEFRLLIKAKIIKNHSKGTNEDILNGLSFLFGLNGVNVPVVVDDNGGMAIQIGIGRQLTFLEKTLVSSLDILARPAGVRINQRISFTAGSCFGFDDTLGALNFGEEGSPAIGGLLAEEF